MNTEAITSAVKSVDWGQVGSKATKTVGLAIALTGGIIQGKRRSEDPITDMLASFFKSANPVFQTTSDVTKGLFVAKENLETIRELVKEDGDEEPPAPTGVAI